jgi:hypothetical protein
LLVVFYPPPRTGRLPGPVAYAAPVLWLAAPVALVLGFGLFKEAYLKFLLVASPAFCLLAGRFVTAPLHRKRWAVTAGEAVLCGVIGVLLVSASAHGLHHYYNNPAYARDDYRGMASYIEAVGRPGDAVLLNAPGQQEVFGYYYDGDLPVYPLPEGRPLDPAATETARGFENGLGEPARVLGQRPPEASGPDTHQPLISLTHRYGPHDARDGPQEVRDGPQDARKYRSVALQLPPRLTPVPSRLECAQTPAFSERRASAPIRRITCPPRGGNQGPLRPGPGASGFS